MQKTLLWLSSVAWALWFGGTVSIFVFGWHLFKALPHDPAAAAASAMFDAFTPYQLIVGAVGLTAVGFLLVTYPNKPHLFLLTLLIMSYGTAITVAVGLQPQMKSMAAKGEQQSEDWRRMHGQSMIAMTIQAAVLASAGAVLLSAVRSQFRFAGTPVAPAEKQSQLSQKR